MPDDLLVTKKIENMERTSVLANERTYSAWIRTGLAALVSGIAFEKFLHGILHSLSVHVVALILITFAACCFALAAWRYVHVGKRMQSTSVSGAPEELLVVLSVALILACVFTVLGIWSYDMGN